MKTAKTDSFANSLRGRTVPLKPFFFSFSATVQREIQKSCPNASNSSRSFCLSQLYRGKSERAGGVSSLSFTSRGKSFIPKGQNSPA